MIIEWLNLLIRWAHVVAGIMWIGESFYFMWLDKAFEPLATKVDGIVGEVWMTHGGNFYRVEKRLIAPGGMPKKLHWFKWEATATWATGFLLLTVLYYFTGGVYLLDPAVSKITPGEGAALGLAILAGGWLVYDFVWASPLGNVKSLALALCYALLGGVAYALTHLFSGRAAFIHIGALLGTIMVLNVWVRILPAQRKMIAASLEGRTPDFTLGARAKIRSTHNSYVTLPVIFIMISNHFPSTYQNPLAWLVLGLLIVLGALVRHLMLVKNERSPLVASFAGLTLLSLIILTAPGGASVLFASPEHRAGGTATFAEAHAIIERRCLPCHSTHPADTSFGPSPGGVSFETPERIQLLAPRIKFRAVESKSMPLANKTGITDQERATLGRWADSL
jgi:uncharacterized membrane protein